MVSAAYTILIISLEDVFDAEHQCHPASTARCNNGCVSVTRKFPPTGGSEQNLASFFGAFSAAAFKFLIGIFITPMLLSGSVMAIACHSIPDHQRKLVGLLVSNWQPRFRQAFSALQDVNS